MKLKVKRIYNCPSYCIGRLYVDGVLFCDTLEDTDRGLMASKGLAWNAARKIPGATAIPKGTYNVTLKVRSPKFGAAKYKNQYGFCNGYLPRLQNVPAYDGVLIHIGNYAKDTDGCLLVGRNTRKGMVTDSTATFRKLYEKLKAADVDGEKITIEIV